MNSLRELLLIIIITIISKENHGMQRNFSDDGKNIQNYCGELKMDENINCTENPICLPGNQYNSSNNNSREIISNQTYICNIVNCIKNIPSICKFDINWSSTSSSIKITFHDNIPNEMLILFYSKSLTCTMITFCEKCSNATETIKNLFHLCIVNENVRQRRNFISKNNLKANEDYNVYLIKIVNTTTIGFIGKLKLKTKRSAPTNVIITGTSSNSISIKWEYNSQLLTEEFYFKIFLNDYHQFHETKSSNITFKYLQPCRKYCFFVSLIDYNGEESDKSQEICITTKPEFDRVEILPVKSELSTFRYIEWKYDNIKNCPISFSVEYGENENINKTTTSNTNVNLTELEINKLYFLNVTPIYDSEKGEGSRKEFFTKEIDNFVEDYIKTKSIIRSFITSIKFKNLPDNHNLKLFNIPIFDEFSMTKMEKALIDHFNRNDNEINIETSISKNKIVFFITISRDYVHKTMVFILKLMNRENHCLIVEKCKTCPNELHETWKGFLSGIASCEDKINSLEKAFLVSHIRLKGIESNNLVSVYSINLSDNETNGTLLQNKFLLILVVILLIIILILIADKKGVLSIDEVINRIRKRYQSNLGNSSNNTVQMKDKRPNSSNIVNRRTQDPNHPQYRLIEEFQKICQESFILEKSNFTSKIALLPENMKKNRFKNILPYDQTRVVLQIRNENNDYINASSIPFIDNSELIEYIASQGPLPNTISDFWYMIWEQNISVIVMLTKVYEGVQLKCEQYWPTLLNTEFAFDEDLGISVFLEEEIKNNSFYERKLKIINRNKNEERKVTQIHMIKWNDFSKPENHDFEECLTRFHEITSGNNLSPYLLHCSAGVGRTGTFITLDRLIKKLVKENINLKIYDVVLELRKYRQHMVQQESQYIFIHEFMDYFMCKFKRQSVECQYDNDFTEISLN